MTPPSGSQTGPACQLGSVLWWTDFPGVFCQNCVPLPENLDRDSPPNPALFVRRYIIEGSSRILFASSATKSGN